MRRVRLYFAIRNMRLLIIAGGLLVIAAAAGMAGELSVKVHIAGIATTNWSLIAMEHWFGCARVAACPTSTYPIKSKSATMGR